MQLTVTRGPPGSEARQQIDCDTDAEALTEVWRMLVSHPAPDLLDIWWKRSDGVELGLADLQCWARER
ncbi:hypothetical protein LJR164_004509 [Phenylobacterium sp. LjRoot164]|uniref:hypothetical protein n=1 Tax=unclassified Phenylobacterium TaxID=2640670 RepID=UPI003ED06B88